ncbi:MAG: hypothetical protein LUD77_01615, partial [Clostridiales bacterium]|nr:hypothetical protein [Clostridiales bacterium]
MFLNENLNINSRIQDRIENLSQKLDILNCIGLYMRGTDYTSLKPKSHFIQPSKEEMASLVD